MKNTLLLLLAHILTIVAIASYADEQDNSLAFTPSRGLFSSETALSSQDFSAGFTFSGWFYLTQDIDGYARLAGPNWEHFTVDIQANNKIDVYYQQQGVGIENVPINSWFNIAITYDNQNIRVYYNGNQVMDQAWLNSPLSIPPEQVFQFGYFHSRIKQFKIWNKGLTQEELSTELNRINSSESLPVIQWLFDEGVGLIVNDTGTPGGEHVYMPYGAPFWHNIHSPYTLLPDSKAQLFADTRLQPEGGTAGSADFDQDGIKEVFMHGAGEDPPVNDTPMLIYKVVDDKLVDVSDTAVEGGLVYRSFPTGRKTIVEDLNNDGYDDVFFVTSSGHFGNIKPEPSVLLMSNGSQGKLFQAHQNIKMPPCTLTAPAFNGQKPCITSDSSTLYPDNNAPLVDFDTRTYGHGADVVDIDGDGDLDLYSQIYQGGERNELPVAPHFLINDGQGNFVANWQLVPFKVFEVTRDFYFDDPENIQQKDAQYLFAKFRDFDGDGFLDMALLTDLAGANKTYPAEDPFAVETDNPWESKYELIAWGDATGFSEEYTILISNLTAELSDATGTHTYPLAEDIDGDGDVDLVTVRTNADSFAIDTLYLQVFINDGGRLLVDRTQEFIPQPTAEVIQDGMFWPHELQSYDFNQDGCVDMLMMHAPVPAERMNSLVGIPKRAWLNNCKGYFTPIRDSYFGKMGNLLPLDIDQDGDLDFVTTVGGGSDRGNMVESHILKKTGRGNLDYFIDTDRDGVLDSVDPDDDGDGVPDTADAFDKISSESADTDGDGIGNNADSDDDGDGLTDEQEADLGTNPLLADTDGDGLSDAQELALGINPLLNDSDGDGWTDSEEITEGTNPLSAVSQPELSQGLPIWLLSVLAR